MKTCSTRTKFQGINYLIDVDSWWKDIITNIVLVALKHVKEYKFTRPGGIPTELIKNGQLVCIKALVDIQHLFAWSIGFRKMDDGLYNINL